MTTGGQIIVGVATGVPSFALGYLMYRRSKAVDKVAEQTGVVTESRAGVAQNFAVLNEIIDNLQADNASFRDDLRRCSDRVDLMGTKNDELRRELNRFYRKYGENGDHTDAK